MEDDSWADDIAKAGTGNPVAEGMVNPPEVEEARATLSYTEMDQQLTDALEGLRLQGTAGAVPAVPP